MKESSDAARAAEQIFDEFVGDKLTAREAMLALAEMLPDDDPERLFTEWLFESGGTRQKILDLGIEPPEPGPDLFRRIKEAVTPILVKQKSEV